MDSVFRKLDELILASADKTAQAWNWTTGRTRKELANLCLGVASVAETTGSFVLLDPSKNPSHYLLVGLIAAVSIGTTHLNHRMNSLVEELEEKSVDGAIPAELVQRKSISHRSGYYFLALGAAVETASIVENRVDGGSLLVGGACLRAGSEFIMASGDYLPPRKNCFQRGMDYLAEKVSRSKGPVAIPVGAI